MRAKGRAGQGRAAMTMRGAARGVWRGEARRRAVESWAGLVGPHGPDWASRPPQATPTFAFTELK